MLCCVAGSMRANKEKSMRLRMRKQREHLAEARRRQSGYSRQQFNGQSGQQSTARRSLTFERVGESKERDSSTGLECWPVVCRESKRASLKTQVKKIMLPLWRRERNICCNRAATMVPHYLYSARRLPSNKRRQNPP